MNNGLCSVDFVNHRRHPTGWPAFKRDVAEWAVAFVACVTLGVWLFVIYEIGQVIK